MPSRIVHISDNCFGGYNYSYVVYDGDKEVSGGVSSSEDWVRADAGGNHTRSKYLRMCLEQLLEGIPKEELLP